MCLLIKASSFLVKAPLPNKDLIKSLHNSKASINSFILTSLNKYSALHPRSILKGVLFINNVSYLDFILLHFIRNLHVIRYGLGLASKQAPYKSYG